MAWRFPQARVACAVTFGRRKLLRRADSLSYLKHILHYFK
jgi:hypothetical protein